MYRVEMLIEEHKDHLYKLCRYLEWNTYDAEELFQDTWVKAIEKYGQYQPSQPFYPWLSQIAVNLYKDRLRRMKLERKHTINGADEEILNCAAGENFVEELVQKERWQQVKACLQRLPDKYKLPIILVLVEGQSYKNAGEILKLSEKMIKSRIHDGRERLKKMIRKEEEGV